MFAKMTAVAAAVHKHASEGGTLSSRADGAGGRALGPHVRTGDTVMMDDWCGGASHLVPVLHGEKRPADS